MRQKFPGAALSLLFIFICIFSIEAATMASAEEKHSAIFAGGCFWCVEAVFDAVPGVIRTTSGYTGGKEQNPNYEAVSSGTTGHAEAVKVDFDPNKVSYQELLEIFWRNIDPTVKERQFCDTGSQYRTAIFYTNKEQKKSAEESKQKLLASGRFKNGIMTEISPAGIFYPAEDYHQKYYVKNPQRYRSYKYACGRDQRLRELWSEYK